MKNRVYDFIVLGATIPGIVFALKKSLDGYSVLLTNIFGFPGGSITEQLNCQQVVDEESLKGLTKNIFRSISGDNFEQSIVNPESVKIRLLQTLTKSNIDLYFHVTPKDIVIDGNGLVEVYFLAKEGITKVNGRKVVDASEEYHGSILLNRKRYVVERRINMFITTPDNEAFLSFDKIRTAVKLLDGRYWVSLTIESNDDLFTENETHSMLDTFRVILEGSRSRIQILPLGVQTIYRTDGASSLNDPIVTIDDIAVKLFDTSEQFLKASYVETNHK